MWDNNYETTFNDICNFSQQKSIIHMRAYSYYYRWDMFFQLQIIILSAIAGTFSFMLGFFPDAKVLLNVISGFCSYYITILSSIYKYLKISQLVEQHITAHRSWEKVYNLINIQLKLTSENRENPVEYLKKIENEYNRLNEISPVIPYHLIKNFENKNKIVSAFRFISKKPREICSNELNEVVINEPINK